MTHHPWKLVGDDDDADDNVITRWCFIITTRQLLGGCVVVVVGDGWVLVRGVLTVFFGGGIQYGDAGATLCFKGRYRFLVPWEYFYLAWSCRERGHSIFFRVVFV